jgi:hypothetical protein
MVVNAVKWSIWKKNFGGNHLSPSRRRAFRREIVQAGRVVQTMLQAAPYLGPRRPVPIAPCERK